MQTVINATRNRINRHTIEQPATSAGTFVQVMPFSFRLPDGNWWQLPIEPLVSVSGGNVVKKRNVAKHSGRGSIKERWAEDDIKISIEGTFVHEDKHTYPANEMELFFSLMQMREAVEVQCELLQLMNVHQVVIESYSLPFSKGENVQNYRIEAVSDDTYNLLIEVK